MTEVKAFWSTNHDDFEEILQRRLNKGFSIEEVSATSSERNQPTFYAILTKEETSQE